MTEADGRRVRRQVYGRTRKEAETKLVDLRSKADSGAAMTPSHLTLEVFLSEWLSQIVAPRVRPNTLAGYAFHVDRYLVPDLGARRLGRLTAREVRLYLVYGHVTLGDKREALGRLNDLFEEGL